MRFGHLVANLVARAVGRVGSIAAAVAAVAIMARALEPAAFGQVMFLLTLVTLFGQVAEFGTTNVMARQIVDHRESPHALWRSFLEVRALLAIASMLLAMAYITLSGTRAPWTWSLIAVLSIPLVAARFFESMFQVLDRTWAIAWSYVVFGALLVSLTAAAAWMHADGATFLAANLIASLAYCGMAVLELRGAVRWARTPDAQLRLRIWKAALPLGIGALFTTLNSRGSVMIIEFHRGPVEVGMFTAALRVLDLAIAAAMIALAPLLPSFSAASAHLPRLRAMYVALLKLLLVVMTPVAIAAPFWAEPIVRLLYGQRYIEAVHAVSWIVLMATLCVLNLLNSYVLLSLHVVKFAAWITGAGAALGLLLNLWLVPRYGYNVTAMIAVLVEALMLAVTFTLLRRQLGPIFETRTWCLAVFAGAVMAVPMYLLKLPGDGAALMAGLLAYTCVVGATGLFRIDRQALMQ